MLLKKKNFEIRARYVKTKSVFVVRAQSKTNFRIKKLQENFAFQCNKPDCFRHLNG